MPKLLTLQMLPCVVATQDSRAESGTHVQVSNLDSFGKLIPQFRGEIFWKNRYPQGIMTVARAAVSPVSGMSTELI